MKRTLLLIFIFLLTSCAQINTTKDKEAYQQVTSANNTWTQTPPKITPSPTVHTSIRKASELFQDVTIVYSDSFQNQSASTGWDIDAGTIDNDVLAVNGNNWAGFFRKSSITEGMGATIEFSYDENSIFEVFIQHGDRGTDSYKRFGIYIFNDQLAPNIWTGSEEIDDEIIGSNFILKSNTDYSILLAPLQDGDFIVIIWNPLDPSKSITYRRYMGNEWSNNDWIFRVGVENGTIEFDNYLEFKYKNTYIPTVTPTPTPEPTITPTLGPTQIGGASGKILASCLENSNLRTMYLYDLANKEYSYVHPELNRSHEDTSVWSADEFLQLSPSSDLVIWEKCDFEDVEYAGYPPKMIKQESITCNKYISNADFSHTIKLPNKEPVYWANNNLALYNSNYDDKLYIGDPVQENRKLIYDDSISSSSINASPNGHYVLVPKFDHHCVEDTPYCYPDLDEILMIETSSNEVTSIPGPDIHPGYEGTYKISISRLGIYWGRDESTAYLDTSVIEFGTNANNRETQTFYSGPIYKLDLETNKIEEISSLSDSAASFTRVLAVSQDRTKLMLYRYNKYIDKWVLYSYYIDEDRLVEVELSENTRNLIGKNSKFYSFILSPDNTKFAFSYNVTRSPAYKENIYVVDFETGYARLIMSHERRNFWSTISWSPDSKWLLVDFQGRDSNMSGDPTDHEIFICDYESCRSFRPPNADDCMEVHWLGPMPLDTGYLPALVTFEIPNVEFTPMP